MGAVRPIRFMTGAGPSADPAKLLAAARRAEELGYSTFVMPDHFMMPFAPLVALQAVADATTTVRLGQLVLAHDFRHPAVLAKELATLDVLSGGRVDVGIGAGWMQSEFEQAGIPFDKPSVRIERLEEAAVVLKGLFGDDPFTFSGEHFTITGLDGTPKPLQRPHPPLMIGGGGRKLLGVAARRADVIQVLPSPNRGDGQRDPWAMTARAFREKIDWIRDAAGERFADIELAALMMAVVVTDDADAAADGLLGRLAASGSGPAADGPSRDEVLSSPLVAIGPIEQVCDKLLEVRDGFGFSCFAAPVGVRPSTLGPVIERLAGA